MKRRTLILIALFFPLASALFALTESEEAYIQHILAFRLSLRSEPTADSAIEKIHALEKAERARIESLGEEARLVATNMLCTAEYNCEYEKDVKSASLEKILRANFEKVVAYNKTHAAEDVSALYVVSSADVINSMMQFLPQSDAIKYGLQEKKDYALVVEKNPSMSLALMNSALWHYFAPGIAGGSKKKAESLFSDALKSAQSDYESYYAAIYLSQFHFEQKNAAACESFLSEAERVLPGTRYIRLIKKINAAGFSLYDYNNNAKRAKVLQKLAAQPEASSE